MLGLHSYLGLLQSGLELNSNPQCTYVSCLPILNKRIDKCLNPYMKCGSKEFDFFNIFTTIVAMSMFPQISKKAFIRRTMNNW